jgi:drug/metabolite transporter (DMT)-like permease
VAALSYGFTIVIGRHLAEDGFHAATVLGVRFSSAGVLLLLLLVALRRPLRPPPGERVRVMLLGMLGYAVESSFFFMALERGSASAVALLFYAYPAIVALLGLAMGRRIGARIGGAIALSAAGTALVVAAGGDVHVSGPGVALALSSAASFAVYLIVSHRVAPRTDALTTATWVALGAGLSFVTAGVVTGAFQAIDGHLPLMLANGVATASAFSFMFAGLQRLGPAPTAVVMTLEALFAIVLAGLFLGESLGPLQLLGGAAILGATILIAVSGSDPHRTVQV